MVVYIGQENYNKIYNLHLIEFRKNPREYFIKRQHIYKFDDYFIEKYNSIQKDILYFPVEKSYLNQISYEDSWWGERSYGGNRNHEGTDIMSNENVAGVIPIVSMTNGVIKNIGWLKLGGYRIGILSSNGIYYYYAHLYSYAPLITEGKEVFAGEIIGFMGNSGYSEIEGTVGMFDVHLHIGIYIYDIDGNEISINPYEFIKNKENMSD